jgi:hypothetical protein
MRLTKAGDQGTESAAVDKFDPRQIQNQPATLGEQRLDGVFKCSGIAGIESFRLNLSQQNAFFLRTQNLHCEKLQRSYDLETFVENPVLASKPDVSHRLGSSKSFGDI